MEVSTASVEGVRASTSSSALKAAGSGNLLDFAGQVCADPRQRGEVFACRYHPGRTSGQIVDYLRGTAIGANAEGVCPRSQADRQAV